MYTLNLLFQGILEFLVSAQLGRIFALSIFFIFFFRILFERHDRVLFFVILGTVLYLPIIGHMLFAGDTLFGGNEVLIITKLGRISYVFQFYKHFPISFIGGAIGFYLAEFFLKSGYISRTIKKSILAIIFIAFFGSWLSLLF
jgi:hypothetical protein